MLLLLQTAKALAEKTKNHKSSYQFFSFFFVLRRLLLLAYRSLFRGGKNFSPTDKARLNMTLRRFKLQNSSDTSPKRASVKLLFRLYLHRIGVFISIFILSLVSFATNSCRGNKEGKTFLPQSTLAYTHTHTQLLFFGIDITRKTFELLIYDLKSQEELHII